MAHSSVQGSTKVNSGKVSPKGVGGMATARGKHGEVGSVPASVPMKGATISKGASKGSNWTTSQVNPRIALKDITSKVKGKQAPSK
ncbi:MAG: hypothetical protein KGI66_01025 [Patescibacteria group bacterium]|nr:hypothetical protein [Patescibacteria group bacterium]